MVQVLKILCQTVFLTPLSGLPDSVHYQNWICFSFNCGIVIYLAQSIDGFCFSFPDILESNQLKVDL